MGFKHSIPSLPRPRHLPPRGLERPGLICTPRLVVRAQPPPHAGIRRLVRTEGPTFSSRGRGRRGPEITHASSQSLPTPPPAQVLQGPFSPWPPGCFSVTFLWGGGLSPLPSGDSPWLHPQWRLILFLVLPLELWGCARDGGGKTRRPSSQQHWQRVLSAPHTLTNSPSRWGPLVPLSQRMAEETEAQRIQATRPFARNLEVMEPGFRPRQAGT